MNDPDLAQAASLEDLAECLRRLYVRADTPSLRELEDRTKQANGWLPGTTTRVRRVRLGRTTLNDVLRGRKFPKKAFLLTFVEALNVDLEVDRQWEQAWDRLAIQYQQAFAKPEEVKKLRQQLTEEKRQAEAPLGQDQETTIGQLKRQIVELRRQLAEAEQQQAQASPASGRPPRRRKARDKSEPPLIPWRL